MPKNLGEQLKAQKHHVAAIVANARAQLSAHRRHCNNNLSGTGHNDPSVEIAN
jgi:hypothetical protein